MIESHAEKLRKRVDVVCEAFLAIVLIELFARDAVAQTQTIRCRVEVLIKTLLFIEPLGLGVLP